MKSKYKNIIFLTMYILIAMVMSGCSNEDNFIYNFVHDNNEAYREKEDYKKDIEKLDVLSESVRELVNDNKSSYKEKQEYTLKELMQLEAKGYIYVQIFKIFPQNDEGEHVFNASSKYFEGVTTEDVLIYIENGQVSLYVPSCEGKYTSYKTGAHFMDK